MYSYTLTRVVWQGVASANGSMRCAPRVLVVVGNSVAGTGRPARRSSLAFIALNASSSSGLQNGLRVRLVIVVSGFKSLGHKSLGLSPGESQCDGGGVWWDWGL